MSNVSSSPVSSNSASSFQKPVNPTTAPSLLVRIKAAVQKVLDKIDAAYDVVSDKLGCGGLVAFVVIVGGVVGALSAFNAPITAAVVVLAANVLRITLNYRNEIFKDKKQLENYKLSDQELSKIRDKLDAARFDEQLKRCTNKDELHAAMNAILAILDEAREAIEALAINQGEKNFIVRDTLDNFKSHYRYVKNSMEPDLCGNWQEQSKIFKLNVNNLVTKFKSNLDRVRQLSAHIEKSISGK